MGHTYFVQWSSPWGIMIQRFDNYRQAQDFYDKVGTNPRSYTPAWVELDIDGEVVAAR